MTAPAPDPLPEFGADSLPIAAGTLFEAPRQTSEALMAAMDELNARYGRHTVFPAAMGITRPWKQRADHRSPRYTTRLSDLPVLRA